MITFIGGMIAMAYFVACLFFLKFWKRTQDSLFMWFALSFGILALQRVAMFEWGDTSDRSIGVYSARLLAFVIILVAVIQKNREK